MAAPRLRALCQRYGWPAAALLAISAGVWIWWSQLATRDDKPRPAAESASEVVPRSDVSPSAGGAQVERPTAAPPLSIPDEALVGPDRFVGLAPLAERWVGSTVSELRQRWRLFTLADGGDAGAAGVVRVVDHLALDPATQLWHVLEQEVMRADAVMVGVPAGFTADDLALRLAAAGYVLEPARPLDAVVVVRLSEATLDAVPAALAVLDEQFPFLAVEPDFLRFTSQATPDDYSPTLWALDSIEAPGAWTIATGSSNVVVAVLDSGLDATHPDLQPNLWTNPAEIAGNGVDDDSSGFVDDLHGWDFAENNALIKDDDGHGTHVSGTIGAVGDNGQGAVGVNWNVRLLPLRCGNGTFPDSTLTNALRYVTRLKNLHASSGGTAGANIVAVNASFGGGGFNSVFRSEIANAGAAGILVVAAAGNDGTNNDVTPVYPASYDLDTIVAVASIHQGNGLSEFSDYGATSVDLAAPGTGIYSTRPGGTYGFEKGTSMAAPHVTGAAALLAAAEPSLTAAQVRARLLAHVDPVPALDGVVATGGKLNLRRTLAPSSARPRVAINSPQAHVIVIDQPGWPVRLRATLLPDKGVTPAATLQWDAPEAPAPVTFSTLAGVETVANFAAPGRYTLRVRAVAGALQEMDTVVVAVGGFHEPDASGLRAAWGFDEADGAALDRSGDNRTGTFVGAARGAGVSGSAATFSGTSGHVAFASPAGLSRVTIAGWARADGAGSSPFPRVVHMREGVLFFGLDGGTTFDDGNTNTLKFALDDGTATPVWHSAPGSISTQRWYHVAVTYDPAAANPLPRLYIDGALQVLGTQDQGTPVAPTVTAGQGFIGDRGDATRPWQGALDGIRIYDREASASEVALLAHEVTAHALLQGAMVADVSPGSLSVPLTFTPAAVGAARSAPEFTAIAWSSPDPGADFAPATGQMNTILSVPSPGQYTVRLDATTTDGVHVVRTFAVDVTGEPVAIAGYYTGTIAGGGSFVLVVEADGAAHFLGGQTRGLRAEDFVVASWGGFATEDRHGMAITGRIHASGTVTGTLGGGAAFSGARVSLSLAEPDAGRDGAYTGWLLDTGIRAAAHVERGRVALVVEEPGTTRFAEGALLEGDTFDLAPATGASLVGGVGANELIAEVDFPDAAPRTMVLFREGHVPARRLANLSVRGMVGGGEAALIPGFVVRGQGTLPMLVRGVGPGLASRGVAGPIAQPRLQLFGGSVLLAESRGWAASGNALDIAATAGRLGAFPLDPDDADTAVLESLAERGYTAVIDGADGGTGIVLAEAYDAGTGGEPVHLVNLSGRGFVGTGDGILIGGFVIAGEAPALVLIRGVGPALESWGVTAPLESPVLTVYRGATPISSAGAWEAGADAAEIMAASEAAGAFALTDGSADAAVVLFLEPGQYTAHLEGLDGTTGIGLMEIYLVPDF